MMNDWDEYKKLVIKDLERHSELLEKIQQQVTEVLVEIASIQTQYRISAAIWGFLGATIPVIFGIVLELVRRPQ